MPLSIDYQEKMATNNLQMELPRLLPVICQTMLYIIDSCVIRTTKTGQLLRQQSKWLMYFK